MNRKSVSIKVIAVLSLFLLGGCADGIDPDGDVTQPPVNVDASLAVAVRAEPTALDPQAVRDIPSATVMHQIFSTLVRLTEDIEVEPLLATSWEKIDDLTYEFTLRDDVYFHNGQPLTAHDVVFSLYRSLNSPATAPIMGPIDPASIVAVDDHTVRVGTLQPFAPLLFHLTQNGAAIVSEYAFNALGEDEFGRAPVGTGPFMFDTWRAGYEIKLIRNEAYFGDVTHIADLTFNIIVEASNRLIALETGEVDIALDMSPSDMARVEETEGLLLLREPDLRVNYLGMNVNAPYLDNILIRQAINHAVDVPLIIDTVMEGVGTHANGPLAPGIFGADPTLEGFSYDPARATELLAAAGVADGFDTTLIVDTDPLRITLATVISNQLAAVGINAEIITREWGTFLEETSQKYHDLFILGWTNSTGDADLSLNPLFHSNSHGAQGNRTFFADQRIDDLIAAGRLEMDLAARLDIYREAQEIIIYEAPWVPLFTGENIVGTGDHIRNLNLHPTNLHRFATVTVE